jgi:hypothetical protein
MRLNMSTEITAGTMAPLQAIPNLVEVSALSENVSQKLSNATSAFVVDNSNFHELVLETSVATQLFSSLTSFSADYGSLGIGKGSSTIPLWLMNNYVTVFGDI